MLKGARNRLAELLPRGLLVRRGARASGRVALTFDDGPNEETPALLGLLAELDVRATFFLPGDRCAAHPALVAETLRRGHEVAGHGYRHVPFPGLSLAALRAELDRTARLLPPRAGRPWVRPPYGRITPRSLAMTAALGYATVLWSLDSDDCRTRDPAVVVRTTSRAAAGDVVLLHEGQAWTRAALPPIVERLRARGLQPCPLGELLDRA